jgi:hypothetical protein
MVPIYRKIYGDGELVLGWPTWDKMGEKQHRMSVKNTWRLPNGRISRACPEFSLEALVEALIFAQEKNQLTQEEISKLKKTFCPSK